MDMGAGVVALDPAEIEERVRRGTAAFSRGDYDAAVALAADDVELMRPGGLTPLRGAEAFRQWMEPDALEDMNIEVITVRVAGNKALVEQRTTARGAGSGIELNLMSWGVWTVGDDGLATRIEVWQEHEHEQALESWGGEPE
jgi:ketosteroid isomerase-like protein